MKFTVKEIVIIGIFAALTAICAPLSIPLSFSPVPITLSILAVFMSAVLLSPKCAVFSQIIYILIGICGAPVFSRFQSGPGVVSGPSGGFLLSYPVIALVISLLLRNRKQISRMDMIGAMVVGLMICYTMGASWYGFSLQKTVNESIAFIAPFLPLDLVKILLVSALGHQVYQTLVKAKLLES